MNLTSQLYLIYNSKDTLAKGGKSMIEKLKKVKRTSFSNSPKAKIVVGTVALAVVIVTSVTVVNMRRL